MHKTLNIPIAIASSLLLYCGSAYAFNFLFRPSAEQINQVNPDSDIDRIDTVRVSLSAETMNWRDRSWSVVGSAHTPRGRFRLGFALSGRDYQIPESQFFIPFKLENIKNLHPSNPSIKAAKRLGLNETIFGIHKNNLRPNTIGAGCLLVSDVDLVEMAQLLPGATIVITD